MTTKPGAALRELLIDALIWYGSDHVPLTVIDILPAADPADDTAIVLMYGGFAGEEELVAMPVRDLLRKCPRIEPSDEAWAEYRARRVRAELSGETADLERVSQI